MGAQIRLRVLEFGELYTDSDGGTGLAEDGEIALTVEQDGGELLRVHLTPTNVMELAGACWAAAMKATALQRKTRNAVARLKKGKE